MLDKISGFVYACYKVKRIAAARLQKGDVEFSLPFLLRSDVKFITSKTEEKL
jgi:hypothetical protein